MTIVQIANDLLVASVEVTATSGFYVGFECSQPVSMQATSIARVAGVVQSVAGAFQLVAVLDGSNDLSTWVAMHTTGDLLAGEQAPFKFQFPSPSTPLFPFAYARVRWILEPEPEAAALADGQRVVLSANLTTGLR